jgi:hypothetical protein
MADSIVLHRGIGEVTRALFVRVMMHTEATRSRSSTRTYQGLTMI